MVDEGLSVLWEEFRKAKENFDFWTSSKRCEPGSQTWAEASARYESARDAYQFALAHQQQRSVSAVAPEDDSSRRDALVGIYSHAAYLKDYDEFVTSANGKCPLSVVALDLDKFKEVNDSQGHDAGDAVLKSVAATLSAVCEHKGSCYRKGGDEFVVLLPNHTQAESVALAERLRHEAAISLSGIGHPNVTLSVGIASYPVPIESAGDLFTKADEALYAAKNAGGDGVRTAGTMPEKQPVGPRVGRLTGKAILKPEVVVCIIQCSGWQLLIEIRNESDADVLVKSVGLWTDGIRLMESWKPDANMEWRIRPQSKLPLNRPTSVNLAQQLVNMNGAIRVAQLNVDLEFRVRCEVSGEIVDVANTVRAAVYGQPPILVQLAG